MAQQLTATYATEEIRLKMSYEEFLELPRDVHGDWIEGQVVLKGGQTRRHQEVLGFLMSFTNYDGFSLERLEWVGTENYANSAILQETDADRRMRGRSPHGVDLALDQSECQPRRVQKESACPPTRMSAPPATTASRPCRPSPTTR